ncbi:GNAT family N-acetyltransferase [Celerinatantimonas yamalensis]|uniref:GNAT family N-acetyltransferase n=1 Tax=Celerinatantimonas yamalensis TaxID=559956 RepID=A0ABW9G7M6_9GAMM
MSIRQAIPSDHARIALLSGQLGYPVTIEQVQQRINKLGAHQQIWVYEQNAQVLAWLQLDRQYQLTSGEHLEILAFVVDEAYRGQGIGQQLLDWVKQLACQQSIELRVRSQVKRERAHQFYQQHGFSWQKSQHLFIYDVTDIPPSKS